MNRIMRIFVAGIVAILPIYLTVFLTIWMADFISTYLGPNSGVGRYLTSIGLSISTSNPLAYALGLVFLVLGVFVLGLVVESRFRPWFDRIVDGTMRRIPVLSNIYDTSKRFVSMVDHTGDSDLKGMTPVWCFFGGEGGAATLALMPSGAPVMLKSQQYIGIIIPTAPVPFGGALLYVPSEWIEPANVGIERLMSIYVSMGMTPPEAVPHGTPSRQDQG